MAFASQQKGRSLAEHGAFGNETLIRKLTEPRLSGRSETL